MLRQRKYTEIIDLLRADIQSKYMKRKVTLRETDLW